MLSIAYKLTIPEPCFQSWENMQPSESGRHCHACNKTVTDFTGFTDEAIQQYFSSGDNRASCGRFYVQQLNRVRITIPAYVVRKKLPAWKRFLLILLICFGSTIFSTKVNAGIQGEVYHEMRSATDKKTKQKKKKRKYRNNFSWSDINVKFDLSGIDTMTMGFTITTPAPAIAALEDSNFVCANDSLAAFRDIIAAGKKKSIPEKEPAMPVTAVLPARLSVATSYRKRKRKQ